MKITANNKEISIGGIITSMISSVFMVTGPIYVFITSMAGAVLFAPACRAVVAMFLGKSVFYMPAVVFANITWWEATMFLSFVHYIGIIIYKLTPKIFAKES